MEQLDNNYPYQRNYVKDLFAHMGDVQKEYRRRLKEDIFSANERRNDDQIFSEAYRITVEELMLTI